MPHKCSKKARIYARQNTLEKSFFAVFRDLILFCARFNKPFLNFAKI